MNLQQQMPSSSPPSPSCFLSDYLCQLFEISPSLMIIIILLTLNEFWLFILLCSHIYLINENLTTNENINSYKYWYMTASADSLDSDDKDEDAAATATHYVESFPLTQNALDGLRTLAHQHSHNNNSGSNFYHNPFDLGCWRNWLGLMFIGQDPWRHVDWSSIYTVPVPYHRERVNRA